MASIAISWYIFAIPLLSFPTTLPVTAANMNCEYSHSNS